MIKTTLINIQQLTICPGFSPPVPYIILIGSSFHSHKGETNAFKAYKNNTVLISITYCPVMKYPKISIVTLQRGKDIGSHDSLDTVTVNIYHR